MAKDLPANVGDASLIPDLEDVTRCRATKPMHLTLERALELPLLKPMRHRGCAPQREATTRSLHTETRASRPCLTQLEKSLCSSKHPSKPKTDRQISGLSQVWPFGLYPDRLLCPWNFSSKNIGVGSHFLLQGIFLTPGSPASPALQADSLPWANREAQ